MICALLLAVYVQACAGLPAHDVALVESVAYDPFNRGWSTGMSVVLPMVPTSTSPAWVLAHEIAHVKQRRQLSFWIEAQTWLPPCTTYAARFLHDPVLYAAENQAEYYAAAMTGEGCS